MKFILTFFLLTLIQSNLTFASTLQDVGEGQFQGKDFFQKCGLIISQEGSELRIETNKGSEKFLLEKISSTREISASDNGQVWIDLNKEGMLYLRIFFNNDRDLEPTSYKIMEGRSNVLEKCSNLERI